MATLDERVTAIEQSLPGIMSIQDMLNVEKRLMDNMEKMLTGLMDKIQTNMTRRFCWHCQ